MEYQQKYRNQSIKKNVADNKPEESSHQGKVQKYTRLDPRNFSSVPLQRSNMNKVMQRKVQRAGSKIQLIEDKGNRELIAEVGQARSTYIQFNENKLHYIQSQDVRDLAEENNGFIESKDFLSLALNKTNARNMEQEGKVASVEESRAFWKKCLDNYYWVFHFMQDVSLWWNGTKEGKARKVLKEQLYEHYAGIRQCCGEDCECALEYLLVNDGGDKAKQQACLTEIEKRKQEMRQECEFCSKVYDERSKKETLPVDSMDVESGAGLWGDDCGNFAKLTQNTGLGTLKEYNNGEDTEVPITEFAFHKWLSLTELKGDLKNGQATAETCAGQGGLFRTVFCIRPTSGKEEINEDRRFIEETAQTIHEIVYDKKKLLYNLALLEKYAKTGGSLKTDRNMNELKFAVDKADHKNKMNASYGKRVKVLTKKLDANRAKERKAEREKKAGEMK